MSTDQLLLATAVAAPLLGSLALPLVGRFSERARDALALLCVVGSLACVAALLPGVAGGATTTVAVAGLDLLHADLDRTLTLAGVTGPADLRDDLVATVACG